MTCRLSVKDVGFPPTRWVRARGAAYSSLILTASVCVMALSVFRSTYTLLWSTRLLVACLDHSRDTGIQPQYLAPPIGIEPTPTEVEAQCSIR